MPSPTARALVRGARSPRSENRLQVLVWRDEVRLWYDTPRLIFVSAYPSREQARAMSLKRSRRRLAFRALLSAPCSPHLDQPPSLPSESRRQRHSLGAVLSGAVLQTAAPDVASFIVARFLMGVSQGLSVGAAPLLMAENAFPTHRGIASSVYNYGWYIGAIVAAWAAFGTRNMEGNVSWQIPSGLMALLPLMTVPSLFTMDESSRWLVSMDRAGEARANLAGSHCGGDIRTALSANYLAIILESVGITSVTDQTLISACLQVRNLVWSIAASVCVDRVGRKVLFMTSGVIMLISYVIVTCLSGIFDATKHGPTGLAVAPFLFICEPADSLSPRGCVSLGAIFFNTFIDPIALDAIQWKHYSVFVVILVAMLFSVWFTYPETRGRTLENMF
ncbi:MFS general substrate transporter [Colletotrichum caudatum]|nr:MFS general substrate transporter [Colletotrichum caudatum]